MRFAYVCKADRPVVEAKSRLFRNINELYESHADSCRKIKSFLTVTFCTSGPTIPRLAAGGRPSASQPAGPDIVLHGSI